MSYKLIIFLLLISNIFTEDATVNKKDEFVPKEKLEDYFKELGLDGKDTLTRDELRSVYKKIISSSEKQKRTINYSPKDDTVIQGMLDKLVDGVPDEFPLKDLDLYLNKERFINMISNMLGGIDLKELAKKAKEQKEKEGVKSGTLTEERKLTPVEGDKDIKSSEFNDL